MENVKSSKGFKVYSGFNLDGMKESKLIKNKCFVAEKDGFTAHGESVKKAISDMQFKIISEKLKNDPISLDTKITVKYYRIITGACDLGCRDFMMKNGIKFKVLNEGTDNEETKELKAISVKDLLPKLEKYNAYGVEKFKSLINI